MTRNASARREARRQQLVDAARKVFARLGYHGASVEDVIREAGVARGTFYNYFPSKRAVFKGVVEDLFQAVSTAPVPIRPELGDVPGQIRANLMRIFGALSRHEDLARILMAETPGLDAEADRDLRDFYSRALMRLERALRAGQQMGVIRSGDASTLSRCLLGMIKEPVFQSMLDGTHLDVESVVDEAFGVVALGLLARPVGTAAP